METVKQGGLQSLIGSLEYGLSNPELLLQVVLIGTVYRLVNGHPLTAGEKPTAEGGEAMMKAMHETIQDMVVGEEAQNMLLLAVAAAFMGFKKTADDVVAKADAADKTA